MILLSYLTLGCTQTVHFPEPYRPTVDSGLPTAHTGTQPPPTPGQAPLIQRSTIAYGCNGADTAFLASFRTLGWSGSASAMLVSSARSERHALTLEDSATDGRWDRYALGPLFNDTTSTPGETTTFACAGQSTLSWVLWITDRVGVPTDCVAWGPDPTGAIAAAAGEAPGIDQLCVDLGARP